MTNPIKNILKKGSDKFELTWIGSTDFSKLSPIKQIYGVLFNENGKMLITAPNVKRLS